LSLRKTERRCATVSVAPFPYAYTIAQRSMRRSLRERLRCKIFRGVRRTTVALWTPPMLVPGAAILEGANTPGDSDSIATLAGALVGARCGINALPSDWVRDVERTAELSALADRVRCGARP